MYTYFMKLRTNKQKAKFLLTMIPAMFAYGIYGIGYIIESFALWIDNILVDFVEK